VSHSDKDVWHRGNYKTNANSVAAFDENGKQIGIVFHDTHGVSELAAVAGVLPPLPGRAGAATGEESRAREDRAGGHA